jgi:hypothetical protein
MSRLTGHMMFARGTRVLVRLKNGNRFVAKFKERKSRFIEFYDHPDTPTGQISVMGIVKGVST